jgi:hypothetical protein
VGGNNIFHDLQQVAGSCSQAQSGPMFSHLDEKLSSRKNLQMTPEKEVSSGCLSITQMNPSS